MGQVREVLQGAQDGLYHARNLFLRQPAVVIPPTSLEPTDIKPAPKRSNNNKRNNSRLRLLGAAIITLTSAAGANEGSVDGHVEWGKWAKFSQSPWMQYSDVDVYLYANQPF